MGNGVILRAKVESLLFIISSTFQAYRNAVQSNQSAIWANGGVTLAIQIIIKQILLSRVTRYVVTLTSNVFYRLVFLLHSHVTILCVMIHKTAFNLKETFIRLTLLQCFGVLKTKQKKNKDRIVFKGTFLRRLVFLLSSDVVMILLCHDLQNCFEF